jgi:propanediol utilization protein
MNDSMAHKPNSMQDTTQQVVHILDAKYEKTDIQSVVSTNCTHLSLQDLNKLLELLTEFEELFDGTLGDWSTEPVFPLN